MVSAFEFSDYKDFLKAWLADRPKNGRGESRKIAARLAVSTTLVSQVLNGDKHFTMETASELADYMALTERECDHFLLLVDLARAGNQSLRAKIKRRIDAGREAARTLNKRLEHDRNLSAADAATFYSHWVYTGVTNWIATQPSADVAAIAERMKVPVTLVAKVMSFLLETGILVKKPDGYENGVKRIHIGADSPLVVKHHQNWRLQGFNQMPFTDKQNLFLTMPMSLSEEVAARIRSDLVTSVEKIGKWVSPSPSEVVRCLNIDWFEY